MAIIGEEGEDISEPAGRAEGASAGEKEKAEVKEEKSDREIR
jgi:hypothetical protein